MELAASLGYGHDLSDGDGTDFSGPAGGNEANPTYVASACWALALLTEVYRNPMVMMRGPLERFQYHRPAASQLPDLTPASRPVSVVGTRLEFRQLLRQLRQ